MIRKANAILSFLVVLLVAGFGSALLKQAQAITYPPGACPNTIGTVRACPNNRPLHWGRASSACHRTGPYTQRVFSFPAPPLTVVPGWRDRTFYGCCQYIKRTRYCSINWNHGTMAWLQSVDTNPADCRGGRCRAQGGSWAL